MPRGPHQRAFLAPHQRAVLASFAAVALLACGSEGGSADAANAETAPPSQKAAATPAKADDGHGHDQAKRAERPLPAFSGWTLDNERLQISSLIGRRLLLFFFNPEVDDSAVVARAISRISKLRAKQNFEIVGIATGSTREKVRSFATALGIDYRVIDDSSASIAVRLGMRTPIALLGIDAEGYLVFGLGQFATDAPNADEVIEAQIRKALRLPDESQEAGASARPMAPLFEAAVLDDDAPFRLQDHRGKPVVLVFFLHTCPHCHEFLTFMKEQLRGMPEDKRPVLVGVEVTGKTYAVRESLKNLELDFFPVLFDDDGSISADYGVFAGVPDTYLINAEGRIAAHLQGWVPATDGPMMRMQLAKAAGVPVPMLLRKEGYSGNEVCGVCHESQQDTWLLTKHSSAYDTLVKHGSDADGECVGCHVVGFGESGGFDIAARSGALEDVGCESCHGRGGPHLSPAFTADGSYETACLVCHDTKHSLGFEYASFLPRISHAVNAAILALPADERRRILEARGAVRKDLLPTTADYVGSEACASCHEAEHQTWSASGHARAMQTLATAGQEKDANCQACHTTALGKPGGFATDVDPASQSDLARVGCESCHGPGGNHIAEDAVKLGSILSLGDKCDSCVILQICGSCHDDANDAGFEFLVLEKIEKVRHGTIEAGTGKPLGDSAWRHRGPPASHGHDLKSRELPELLARAFAAVDATDPEWPAR